MLLGVLLILAPFAGLPSSWLAVIVPVLGVLVVGVGFSLRLALVRAARHEEVPAVVEEAPAPAPAPSGVSPI